MSREAYEEIARLFVSVVERIPEEKWGDHGLGEWTVRDLVGHASRAMLTVETYTAKPSTEPVTGYGVSAPDADRGAFDKAVAERGREAGKALGNQPATAVRELADRVLARVPTISDDFRVETPFGVLEFGDYLPTRTLELVVHTLDIASATGLDVTIPERPMIEALAALGRRAVRRGQGPLVALALTGRAELPPHFTVV